jgi:repressor LexA
MSSLTFKQARVRDFIAGFIAAEGYSPSFEEIGEALGLRSLATVSKHIEILRRKGAIKQRPGRSRSIEVVARDGIKVACPHCQNVFKLDLARGR